jgi:hypothetical protein
MLDCLATVGVMRFLCVASAAHFLLGGQKMKCPNCGAEIGAAKSCDYCGSQISAEMQKEQEQLNKSGCPKCSSTNITFKRENQGEVRGKNSKQVIHRTVGYCNDCGATWYADSTEKKRKTWLWVLGWIFIFPLPLTLILIKKKDMKPILRYGIIAVAWIVYLIIGFSGNASDTKVQPSSNDNSITTSQQSEVVTQKDDNEATTQEITETTTEPVPTEYLSALIKAQMYSDTLYMSKAGIYDQLVSPYGEKFSKEAADYAIERVNADWNHNALMKAKTYQTDMAMSPSAIHDQLVSQYGEKFTKEEADYAIEHLND